MYVLPRRRDSGSDGRERTEGDVSDESEIEEEIEQCEADVDLLKAELRDAEKRRAAAWLAEAPYLVGQVIEVRRNGVWEEARVANVTPKWRGYFEYRASFRKKNGAWGEPRHAYDNIMRPASVTDLTAQEQEPA